MTSLLPPSIPFGWYKRLSVKNLHSKGKFYDTDSSLAAVPRGCLALWGLTDFFATRTRRDAGGEASVMQTDQG